jgi:Protein of unknown function (DUF3151)
VEHRDLLGGAGPTATFLLEDETAKAALAKATGNQDRKQVAADHPAYSAAWAALAEDALKDNDPVAAYAYARTGYHRGLDQLRRSGWRGNGPVPWSHEPNRGFLRALYALGQAARQINEHGEAERCAQFLRDSSQEAAEALAS